MVANGSVLTRGYYHAARFGALLIIVSALLLNRFDDLVRRPLMADKCLSFSPASVAHGAKGFEDFGDRCGVCAREAFGHGFGGDEMDWWHLMVFQRRGWWLELIRAAPLKK